MQLDQSWSGWYGNTWGSRPLIKPYPRLILGSWRVKSGSTKCEGNLSHQLRKSLDVPRFSLGILSQNFAWLYLGHILAVKPCCLMQTCLQILERLTNN